MYVDRTDTILSLGAAGVFSLLGVASLIGAVVEWRWDLLVLFLICAALAVPLMREGLHESGIDIFIKRGRQWFRRTGSGTMDKVV